MESSLLPTDYTESTVNATDFDRLDLDRLHENWIEKNIITSLFIIIVLGFFSLGITSFFAPKCDGDKSFSEFAGTSGTTALGALVAVLARKRSRS